MGDRPESSSRGRMSEDKVRRKDWCWSVRAVYVLGKLSDVSGPSLGEVGRYNVELSYFYLCFLFPVGCQTTVQFFEMPKHEALKALDIYRRAGQQVTALYCSNVQCILT